MKDIFRKVKINMPDYLNRLFYDAAAFISFALLTFLMTFPLVFKINKCIAGFFSTDEPSIWYLWWLRYSHTHQLPSAYSHLIAAPFGLDLSFFEIAFPLWIGIKKFLAINFNEFFAYNFEILCGFLLSAFFVYLLLRYLKKKRLVSAFSGMVFAFCPYHFARAWQHIGLAHTEWLVLFLLAIFRLKDKFNKRNIIFAFLSLYLVFAFDTFYAFFSLVIASVFLASIFLMEKKAPFKFMAWLAAVCLANTAIFISRLLPILELDKPAGAWNMVRPFEDLFSQSARPLSYFLPASVHPIFGKFTEQFVGSKLYGMSFTEHTLYLGWVPLILAFIAFRNWKGNKNLPQAAGSRRQEQGYFYTGFFSLLAVTAWLFSQPPWWNILGFKIYMPSFFIYKVIPVFRAYCRFGVVVMLAVAVLAGFGLDFFLERFKTRRTKVAAAIFIFGLVLFEFWNYPPFKLMDFNLPQAYHWLKGEQGDFIIAEYPLDNDGPSEIYKFYQTKHEKRIINGTIPGTYANRIARGIGKLSSPKTAGILKWLGVKYAFMHNDDYLKTGLIDEIEEAERIPANPGLRLIKSFPARGLPREDAAITAEEGRIDLYEIVAAPIEPQQID